MIAIPCFAFFKKSGYFEGGVDWEEEGASGRLVKKPYFLVLVLFLGFQE